MAIIYEPFKILPLSEFHEELRFEFPDLPAPLFDYYLLRTAIKMAKTGNLVRRKAIIHPEECVTRYRLEAPDGMTICGVLDIRIGHPCEGGSKSIPRSFVPPEGYFCCQRNTAWYDDQDKIININPVFCHSVFYISLSVTPDHDSCGLPEVFYSEHFPTLMLGTRAHILLITKQPWTNLQLGQGYYNEFLRMIRMDAIKIATHKMRGGIKMNFGRIM